ncbi:alpha/beta fold hydrolase [Baekduia soli]|nr:alpha/beta fold hydrolase [Baekduia soli]
MLLAAMLSLAALAGTSTAQAAIPWAPCATAGFECATVGVPLDRTGAVPGTISLAVSRVPAASNPNREAVVALAGGPGQAALPLAPDFATVLAPEIATRDLLVFDQRGTGLSGGLDCNALHQRSSLLSTAASCAAQLGPARGSYKTPDSVEDIEALRVAGGYDKLVLFGVSYGTKVALAYAAAHPANVSALILDSVVLPEGPDPFQRSTLSTAPRVLRELCANRACARATPDVTGDLTRMAAKLRKSPLRGRIVLTSGRRAAYSMNQTGLLDILLAGDLNPTLRAELPGSMRAALRGDAAPLLRLSVRSEGLTTGFQSAGGDSDALFLATTCEEAAFPWTRTASTEQRATEVTAAANQIPRAQLGPFSPKAALQGGPIPYCLGWPDQSPAPAPPGPLPQVPTLVLDGQMDLRTPFEDAAQVPARIPGAAVVEIPNTGHSVLGSDQSTCAKDSLAAFAAGQVPGACPATANPFRPTPRPPTRLSQIAAKGVVRKTIVTAAATVTDARRQIIGDALALGTAPRRVAGLRGGGATVTGSTFRLRSYQYVPGVVVSGTSDVDGNARLSVHGGGTAAGTLTITKNGAVTGRLGGKKVRFAVSAALRDRLPSLVRVLAQPRLGG